MTLADLASIGSFISGFAVLISLVFLYFQVRQVAGQVRQAEQNQRATILQVRANRHADMVMHLLDAAVADAFTKALRCDEDLTFTEMSQFIFYARAYFINAEDAFNQHRDGLLGERGYRAFLAQFGQQMAHPAYRTAWRTSQWAWGQEFAEFVEQLMVERPVRPLRSPDALLAEYKSGHAAEVSRASIAAAH
jgi:hypothetical protein